MTAQNQFDHEKLEVYNLALKFVAWLSVLLSELRVSKTPHFSDTINQMDRSGTSIVLNIAEGNGRRATKQRARFFDDARGSATETAACLDVAVAKSAAAMNRVSEGKALLLRIVSMLTRLVDRYEK